MGLYASVAKIIHKHQTEKDFTPKCFKKNPVNRLVCNDQNYKLKICDEKTDQEISHWNLVRTDACIFTTFGCMFPSGNFPYSSFFMGARVEGVVTRSSSRWETLLLGKPLRTPLHASTALLTFSRIKVRMRSKH